MIKREDKRKNVVGSISSNDKNYHFNKINFVDKNNPNHTQNTLKSKTTLEDIRVNKPDPTSRST